MERARPGFGVDQVTVRSNSGRCPHSNASINPRRTAARSRLLAEHHGAAAEARAGEPRAQRAGFHGRFHQPVERRRAHLQPVAQAGVRFQEQPPEAGGVVLLHGRDRGPVTRTPRWSRAGSCRARRGTAAKALGHGVRKLAPIAMPAVRNQPETLQRRSSPPRGGRCMPRARPRISRPSGDCGPPGSASPAARESGAPPAARIRSARRSLLWKRARRRDPCRRRACPRIARLPGRISINSSKLAWRWLAQSRPRVKATISAEDDASPAAGGRSDATAASTPRAGAPFAAHRLGRRPQIVLPIARRRRSEVAASTRIPAGRTRRADSSDQPVGSRPERHANAPANGDGQHGQAVIVDVLADQVDAAGGGDYPGRGGAGSEGLNELLPRVSHSRSRYQYFDAETRKRGESYGRGI